MKILNLIFSILLLLNFLYLLSLDYTIPPNTYSIQSGDIDNDGDNDIVIGHINPGTLSFIENDGNGQFEFIHSLGITGIAKCYFLKNLDDNPAKDAVVYSRNDITGFVTIVYNEEYQTPYSYDLYININTPIPAMSCGDFGGNGDYDLVFSSYGPGLDNLWGIMHNLGNREFSEPEWFECPNQASNAGFYNLNCCDLDNNGRDDIIAYTNYETYIYYNYFNHIDLDSLDCIAPNGNLISDDFDNDGDYDIIVTHWPGGQQSHFLIYENIGNHEFILHDVTYQAIWGIPYTADINNDNLSDIVNVGNAPGAGIRIYYNLGNMEFDDPIFKPVQSYGEDYYRCSFHDFDGNNYNDLAIIRYGILEDNLTILYNDGEGNFMEEPQTGFNNYELIINNSYLSNFPNPFNQTTTISFVTTNLHEKARIEIYNIKGEKVKSFNCQNQVPIIWDGRDEYRNQADSGIYFYRLISDERVLKTKKMLLMR